jgi:hypothetical protein
MKMMQSPASRRNRLVKVDVSQDARREASVEAKIKLTGSLSGSGQL